MEEEDCDVVLTLHIASLASFFGLEESESRTTPFQEEEDDEDIPTEHARSSINHPPSNIKDTNQGQLTRSHVGQETTRAGDFIPN
jgi:hypothetical protein